MTEACRCGQLAQHEQAAPASTMRAADPFSDTGGAAAIAGGSKGSAFQSGSAVPRRNRVAAFVCHRTASAGVDCTTRSRTTRGHCAVADLPFACSGACSRGPRMDAGCSCSVSVAKFTAVAGWRGSTLWPDRSQALHQTVSVVRCSPASDAVDDALVVRRPAARRRFGRRCESLRPRDCAAQRAFGDVSTSSVPSRGVASHRPARGRSGDVR